MLKPGHAQHDRGNWRGNHQGCATFTRGTTFVSWHQWTSDWPILASLRTDFARL